MPSALWASNLPPSASPIARPRRQPRKRSRRRESDSDMTFPPQPEFCVTSFEQEPLERPNESPLLGPVQDRKDDSAEHSLELPSQRLFEQLGDLLAVVEEDATAPCAQH